MKKISIVFLFMFFMASANAASAKASYPGLPHIQWIVDWLLGREAANANHQKHYQSGDLPGKHH